MAAELHGGKKVNAAIEREKGVIFVRFYTFFMEGSKPDYDEISRPVCDLTYVGNTAQKTLKIWGS